MFNNKLSYVRNILSPAPSSIRPSNFLYADILEYLIRNRKVKIDYSVEGYASARTVVQRMGQLGYDESDAFNALSQLSKWNLIEPESLLTDEITLDDPLQVHASGFVHMRYFLKREEYLFGVTADLAFSSFEEAKAAANVWSIGEPRFRSKQRTLNRLADYFKAEYERRIRRHAFYEDLGYGGKAVVSFTRAVADGIGRPPGNSVRGTAKRREGRLA